MTACLRRLILCAVVMWWMALPAWAATAADKSFDWTGTGIALTVKNQEQTNNCWAVASTEALEASWSIRNKQGVVLSPQPIIDRTRNTGPGFINVALDQLKDKGTALESVYPYTHKLGEVLDVATPYRLDSWGYVAQDGAVPTAASLKEALLQHGPVVVTLDATPSFKKYPGGVHREAVWATANQEPHALLVVGWDDDKGAWKVKNSWGTTWGDKGFGLVAYGSLGIGGKASWVEAQQKAKQAPTTEEPEPTTEETTTEEPETQAEVLPPKKVVVPGKTVVVPGKTVLPSKTVVVPGKTVVVPTETDVLPPKIILPGRKVVGPGRNVVVPGRNVVVPTRKVVPTTKVVRPTTKADLVRRNLHVNKPLHHPVHPNRHLHHPERVAHQPKKIDHHNNTRPTRKANQPKKIDHHKKHTRPTRRASHQPKKNRAKANNHRPAKKSNHTPKKNTRAAKKGGRHGK